MFSFVLTLLLSAQCFISDAYAEPAVNDMQYLSVHNSGYEIEEVLNTVGTRGRKNRRLAVSCTFSYLNHNDEDHPVNGKVYPMSVLLDELDAMLKLSEKHDVPVIIHLDGVVNWFWRHDLWNWWMENEAGYNPDNINNVERFDWGTSTGTAVKVGWMNWRTPLNPLRTTPHPNIASPVLREAQAEALDKILPIIVKWYNKLPSDRKYLLAGVVFGWELSTYHQAYYLEDGNNIYGDIYNHIKPPEDDPFPEWGPGGNVLALGYAAAQTLGLQKEGGQITRATEDAICLDYLKFLIRIAVRHGIDAKKIITHTMPGFEAANGGGFSGRASFIDADETIPEGVIPGWTAGTTFYANYSAIITIAEQTKGAWAAIECPAADIRADLLTNMFNYKKNRFINIFNWAQIKNDKNAIDALRKVLMDGGSVSVGEQNGAPAAGTAGFAKFQVTTTEIIDGTDISLNNINSAAGIALGTAVTTGDSTTLIIWTTAETPEGVHPMTVTIDGITSNSFNLVVVNKVSLEDLKYYPNPIQPSKGPNYSSMQFSNIPAGTGIKIYTLLGQIVRELKADGSGTAVWDGKNNAGEKAASGVYIVYMEDGNGNKKRIKVAVER